MATAANDEHYPTGLLLLRALLLLQGARSPIPRRELGLEREVAVHNRRKLLLLRLRSHQNPKTRRRLDGGVVTTLAALWPLLEQLVRDGQRAASASPGKLRELAAEAGLVELDHDCLCAAARARVRPAAPSEWGALAGCVQRPVQKAMRDLLASLLQQLFRCPRAQRVIYARCLHRRFGLALPKASNPLASEAAKP